MLAAIALIEKQTRLIVSNEPELIRKFLFFTSSAPWGGVIIYHVDVDVE